MWAPLPAAVRAYLSLPAYPCQYQFLLLHRSHHLVAGCQMNVNDSEVIASVLSAQQFTNAQSAAEAGVVLLNTCAIRQADCSIVFTRVSGKRVSQSCSLALLASQSHVLTRICKAEIITWLHERLQHCPF